MIYALTLAGILFALYLFWEKKKQRERAAKRLNYQSVRVFQPDSDPFTDRIEFHIRKGDDT